MQNEYRKSRTNLEGGIDMAILSCFPNNADEAANKEYIDGLVGDVESLLETI